MAKIVGNGTTFTLVTDGIVTSIGSMDMPNWAGEDVDVTDLDAVDFLQYLYSGLADGGEVSMEIFTDPALADPTIGLVQVGTIVLSDGTATKTLSGSGYVRENSLGTASPGEAVSGTLVFKFDGIGTVPNVVITP